MSTKKEWTFLRDTAARQQGDKSVMAASTLVIARELEAICDVLEDISRQLESLADAADDIGNIMDSKAAE